MTRLLLTTFLLMGLLLPGMAQEVVFSGRIIDERTGQGLRGVRVRVVGVGERFTDDEGIFSVALPRDADEIQVEMPEGWKVLWPEDGRAPVPRDASYQIRFQVKQLENRIDQLERTVERLQRENKLQKVQIDSLKSAVTDSAAVWQTQLQALQLSKSAVEDSLRRRIERLSTDIERSSIRENQQAAYREISSALRAYLYRAKDLRDWLGHVEDVFLHPQSGNAFYSVIGAYNAAWDTLYRRHDSFEDQVRRYWADESLARELEAVNEQALKEIHEQIILPLDQSVVGEMRRYASGQSPRLAAQNRAKKAADQALEALALPLRQLEQEIDRINIRLSVGD